MNLCAGWVMPSFSLDGVWRDHAHGHDYPALAPTPKLKNVRRVSRSPFFIFKFIRPQLELSNLRRCVIV